MDTSRKQYMEAITPSGKYFFTNLSCYSTRSCERLTNDTDPARLLTSQNQVTVTLAQEQCLSRFTGLTPERKPEWKGYVFLVSNTHRGNELYLRLHPKFAYLYENVTLRVTLSKALASLRNCNPTFNMKETRQISGSWGQINVIASSVTSVMHCGPLGKHLSRHLRKRPEILPKMLSQKMSYLFRYSDLLLDL